MFESEEINNDITIQMHPNNDNSKVNAIAIIPFTQCRSTLQSYPLTFINHQDNNPVGSGDTYNYAELQF